MQEDKLNIIIPHRVEDVLLGFFVGVMFFAACIVFLYEDLDYGRKSEGKEQFNVKDHYEYDTRAKRDGDPKPRTTEPVM